MLNSVTRTAISVRTHAPDPFRPPQALNAIVVASYKKYALVSLLSRGSVPPLPKYTPSVVQRSLKAASAEYYELVAAFASTKASAVDDVQKVVAQHREAFDKARGRPFDLAPNQLFKFCSICSIRSFLPATRRTRTGAW